MNYRTAVIGLGVMGQRMLNNMSHYPGFEAVSAWDPDEAARERTAAHYPQLRVAASASEAIDDERVEVVYIASPPASHRHLAMAAIAASKAVYCEKPLGVNIEESQELVAVASAARVVNIVNFSLASALATQHVEGALAAGECGDVLALDINLHFSTWPRAWQIEAAGWLSKREQGGFTREVLSHWIYLSERLFGPATLVHAWPQFPQGDGAETQLQALLRIGSLPVMVCGTVGGAGPDVVEFTIRGERASFQIRDWNQLYRSDNGQWQNLLAAVDDPREAGYQAQLANANRAVAGQAHSMPDFQAALSVQVLIEAMLAGQVP